MKPQKFLFCLLILAFSLVTTYSQEAFVASGGAAAGTGGTISYSVGQLVGETATTTNGTVFNGVQIPYEISVITEIKPSRPIDVSFQAFPNPAKYILNLKVDNFSSEKLSYRLYNSVGELIKSGEIRSTITQIDMNNLKSANYILCVSNNLQLIKSFQIIKN